ncbi:MAG: class I SAM-dependent methyltransferase [Pikeienuella sp.]
MKGDRATLEFYDRDGAVYADRSAPKGGYVWLERFISVTPARGRLLDYGCGGGWVARRMRDAGRRVEAFDGAPGLVAEASRLTGLDVRLMDFDAFDAVARYDGLWASFCLLHAPRAAMAGHLGRIHRALRPDGVFYLGLKRGEGERRDSLGRFYVHYQPEEISALLDAASFADVEILEQGVAGYDGELSEGMHIYCWKPANG